MESILQVKSSVVQSDSVIETQYHTYTPYTTSFNNNDEIRITIQSQDLYVLPSESYLLIELVSEAIPNVVNQPNGRQIFVNNFISFFFSEMRYEIDGVEIDRCKNPGITSLLKSLVATRQSDKSLYALYNNGANTEVAARTFKVILPLRFIFGFCDDHKKILLNCKHELVLVRSRTDTNVFLAPVQLFNFRITKIHWKIQHISLSDHAKLSLFKTLSRNDDLPLIYRSWDLYELPLVPSTTRHHWSVKTTTQMTKPRYVIVGFQTNKNNILNANATLFDHCNITDVKLFMNNQHFPYDNLNSSFVDVNYSELYHMLLKIQKSYYSDRADSNPVELSYVDFLTRPIFAFDCSRSDERVKGGMVDVRVEIQSSVNIAANTAAFCLIIHDNLVWYSPFSNIVRREI